MKQQSLIFLVAFIVVAAVSSVFISNSACAKVTGPCANCHTMHNSQGGSPMATGGPYGTLLVNNCVGCHSSTTSATIIDLGGSRIPIVYNTVEPAKPLAGGNFYWVVNGNPAYSNLPYEFGHNVLGISGEDEVLTMAPGNKQGCSDQGCHFSLAREGSLSGSMFENKNGCQGCHFEVAHHNDNIAYRFLYGHGSGTVNDRYVEGLEDPDWEQSPNASVHNEYKGNPADHGASGTSNLNVTHNMSAYCKGCHTDFHVQSDGSSWIRHPSDAVLPSDNPQYAAYTVYNPQAPVARPDPTDVANPSVVTPGTDMVMCLSCHRSHGSPHPDILRWDYNTMNAGTTGVAAGTGCFVCHTNKDGS